MASVAQAPFSDLHHMAQIQKSELDLDISLIMELVVVSILVAMILLCLDATGTHCRFVLLHGGVSCALCAPQVYAAL